MAGKQAIAVDIVPEILALTLKLSAKSDREKDASTRVCVDGLLVR
jgi:hypothetical protein